MLKVRHLTPHFRPALISLHGLSFAFLGALLFAYGVFVTYPSHADQPGSPIDTYSDTWVATDALGRELPDSTKIGPPRPDRFVAMFYFLTGGSYGPNFRGPYDNSVILKEHPEAINEINNPAWGPEGAAHYWGKPLLGYYRSDDEWVLRKHAAMLANAGVDLLIFDCSNAVTYTNVYHKLFEVFTEIRREGGKTPQVAFLCPFSNFQGIGARTSRFLYDDIYSKRLDPDLWFRWKGKPLLIADPGYVEKDLQDFFTLRSPVALYNVGATAPNQWGWLDIFPQAVFPGPDAKAEEMAVGVAQNYNKIVNNTAPMSWPGALGRSYHNGATDTSPGAVNYGYNFSEQWEEALKKDPELIWVTGWNEWTAGKYPQWVRWKTPPVVFVDEFDQEHSRDIEPMEGGHGDDYYYQLVSYVRKYKGVRPLPLVVPAPISLDGNFNEWNSVQPTFYAGAAGPVHRDHLGEGIAGPYKNSTGRNQIVTAKVSYDAENIYFYVQTKEPISSCTDPNWMLLYLNTDANYGTGWLGYDFVVNRRNVTAKTTTIERNMGGKYTWGDGTSIPYIVKGNELELIVPRKVFGTALPATIDFKWADNIQQTGDATDFTLNGDSAPDDRFNFRAKLAPLTSGEKH